MTLLEELKARELFFATTSEDFEEYLENNKVTFYLGCDPTGDSLHVGHLVTYLVAKRLQEHGHHPILLVGGATGQIGDPKQQGERKMLSIDVTNENVLKLKKQVKEIFHFDTIVNNLDWTINMSVLDFLRTYGKEFNVNYMINKETVKARLETGISYTEFSYQILQALDWYHLYKEMNCTVQIGGQDQWGNMTAGTDLIRKKEGSDTKVYAMTIPLILKPDGTKFGKSESGKSVWLDKDKTSPYEFYQFWINLPDSDVIKKMKQFTFLSLDEIAKIQEEWEKAPETRLAQKTLAREMTTFIHGKEACDQAIKITNALFNGNIKDLTAKEIEMGFNDFNIVHIEENMTLVDLLIACNVATSKREAREFLKNGAISVNGDKITDEALPLSKDLAIEGKYVVLRRGKKKYALASF
ncbi:MAG: tyrosine--tRNA ligase [Candidatus Caccosoma sp.]|nr:tyrosine--tRNA ligase [Candidatus Caccosoma sp.]